MKVNPIISVVSTSALLVAGLSAGETRTTETSSTVTKGEIHVSKLVRKNVKPLVTWDLTVTETLLDLISFESDGKLIAKTDLQVTITILGTGVTSGSGSNYKSYTTKGLVKFGGNSWVTIHKGNENAVTPGKVVYQAVANKGQAIRFKAAYYYNGWKPYRSESSDEILTLIDGDSIPTNKPVNEAVASAEDFLKPHLDANGKISIGDLDVIYVAELTHTRKSDGGYDLQDLIVHMSFAKVTN